MLTALRAALRPLPTETVEHSSEPPSPWAGYKLCLTDIPRCSHLLILQDDVRPVANFVPAVKMIAKAQPENPVCLFLGALPRLEAKQAQRAMKLQQRYIPLSRRSFMPVVATLWPRHKAVEFLEWAEAHPHLFGRTEPRSDDAMGGRWKQVTRQTVLACVPSIVEHPDEEPSIVGLNAQWGKGSRRTAPLLASDASIYDWLQP